MVLYCWQRYLFTSFKRPYARSLWILVTNFQGLCLFYCMSVFIREDLGFRWMSEQVSHHPPVSAFHAEGLNDDFLFNGSIYPKLKFWGKSVEAEPRGIITLELPKWGVFFFFFGWSEVSLHDWVVLTLDKHICQMDKCKHKLQWLYN